MGARRHLLLYDGVCGLCDRLNRFVLARDKGDRFRFASLQGAGGDWARRFGKDPGELSTFYVVADYEREDRRLLARGRAGLFVLDEIGGVWKVARVFGVLPDRVLDKGYDLIARNRYRWFGRHEQCLLPPPGARWKFLEEA